jgi:DNA-binding HxlR family transcriptional regulator
MAAALDAIGEKWSLLAIRELFLGNRRFDQIARNTGAPRDRLTARLRALEAAGVIERVPYQERPVRYEYRLTDAGRDLSPMLTMLRQWGERWVLPGESPVTFTHGADGHRVQGVVVCETCGRRIGRGRAHPHMDAQGWDVAGPVSA